MNWSVLSNLLRQLSALSPMPSDATLLKDDNDLADRYDALIEEIRHHLAESQLDSAEEAEVVTVLADSFGLGGGMGIYWGTLHLLQRCTPSIAYPIIQDRAIHGPPGSRKWCAFILGRRRNDEDVPLLLTLLHDGLLEVQAQALHSLVMLSQAMPLQRILARVYPLLEHPDPQVSEAAQSAIDAIGS